MPADFDRPIAQALNDCDVEFWERVVSDIRNLRIVHQLRPGIHSHAPDDRDIISLSALLNFHGPSGAAARMAGRQIRDERGAAQLHRVMVVQNLVDGMLFAAGRYLDQIDASTRPFRFKERLVVLDSKKIDTLLVIPL